MAESKGTVVTRNLVADYLDIGNSEKPDIRVMSVFETIDENPNAQTTQKHYTADKSATTLTTGYQTQFPITADLYKDNKVVEFIRDIGEEQKLGVEADYRKTSEQIIPQCLVTPFFRYQAERKDRYSQ